MSIEAMAKSSFGSLKVFASVETVARNASAIRARSVFIVLCGKCRINASHSAPARRYVAESLMTNSNSELEARLQDKFRAMCEAIGHSPALSTVRISPPPADWETNYFLRGWNEGLFEIDSNGEVGSDLIRTTEENQHYRIFSREPPRLLRENLCQLAAAARLIFERGWLKHHLALEASGPGYRAPADGFDLLVRSTAGEILIWVEVKRSAAELEKLVADLRACSRRGPHSREDCGFPQNHPR